MFLGLGPWGCSPLFKALVKPGNRGACLEELTTLVKLHNKALSEVLPKLESELKGLKYSTADFYTFLSERINNPSKYGMLHSHSHFHSAEYFISVVLRILFMSD